MVITTTKQIGGKTFTYHYSDSGFYIERDGVLYVDAYDLPQFDYTYTESNVELPQEVLQEIQTLNN